LRRISFKIKLGNMDHHRRKVGGEKWVKWSRWTSVRQLGSLDDCVAQKRRPTWRLHFFKVKPSESMTESNKQAQHFHCQPLGTVVPGWIRSL
jgi:hypothetical protein